MPNDPDPQPDEIEKSLGDQATGADVSRVDGDRSLGDQATTGDASGDDRIVSLGDQLTAGDDFASMANLDGAESGPDGVIPIVDLSERYEIHDTLGKGGMGEVLRAVDTRLKRPVAIKRVLGEMTGSQKALSRFLTEAQSIAALNHFNIVQIYDYGRDAQGPFIIMELVEGESLQERLRRGKLEIAEAIDMACQLCDGLSIAHDRGIIHRDIKPANILLTKRGEPKLTDFGLARQETIDEGQTQAGALLGTIDFMAPEQQREATAADARSDMWSLAATVYQMVTGKSPVVIRLDRVPDVLREVLHRALQEDPTARYQTVQDFKTGLRLASGKRSATGAVATGSDGLLAEGYCTTCGTINDLSRTFCRSCASSLREECLSCGEEKPVWEPICGECGGNLSELVAEKRKAMKVQQDNITLLREEKNYKGALEIIQSLSCLEHPRFTTEKEWVEKTVALIQAEHQEQIQYWDALVSRARTEKKKGSFIDAIALLEQIPEDLRQREPEILSLLHQCESDHREKERLIKEIEQQVALKELTGLLDKINRLLELNPNNLRIKAIQSRLVQRREKSEARAAELMERAEQQYAKGQNEKVLATLEDWPQDVSRLQRFWQLRDRAQARLARLQELGDVSELLATEEINLSMLPRVEEFLRLQPDNKELQAIAERLKREELQVLAVQQETQKVAIRQKELIKYLAWAGILAVSLVGFLSVVLFLRGTLRNRAVKSAVAAGTEFLEAGLVSEAITEYDQVLQWEKDNVEALSGRAWARMFQPSPDLDAVFEDLKKSEKVAPDTERLKPVWARAYAQQVVLRAQAGNIKEAVAARLDAKWNSRLLQDSDKRRVVVEALETAEKALAIAYLKRATLSAKAAKIALVEHDLQKAKDLGAVESEITEVQKTLAPAYLVRAEKGVHDREIDQAFKDLLLAESLDGSPGRIRDLRVQAWIARADILKQAGETTSSLEAINQAENLDPDIALQSRRAELHVLEAQQDLEKKEFLSCMHHFSLARGLDNKVEGLIELAIVLADLALNSFDQAPTLTNYQAVAAVLDVLGSDEKYVDQRSEIQLRFVRMRGKPVLEFEEDPTDANRVQAILTLQAIEAEEKESAGVTDLRLRMANGLLKRAVTVVDMAQLDGAVLDLEMAKVFAANAKGMERATSVVAAALSRRCRTFLEDGEVVAAGRDYETLASLDEPAADRLLPRFTELSEAARSQIPVAVLARFPAKLFLSWPIEKNSIGMTFRLLPPGVFVMGSPPGEIKRGSFEDEHRVTLTRPFYLGLYEVTQQQYKQVMGSDPSHFKGLQHPVDSVSWQEASSFCQKLSALPAEKKAGHVYRLPTEAEWEYACRANTRTAYSFGDNPAEIGAYAWTANNSTNETHPVGQRKPNPWGLYDMHGNVYEWCADWQGEFSMGDVTDPRGKSTEKLALRGGSFKNPVEFARSAAMQTGRPEANFFTHGFRVLREYHSRADARGTAANQVTQPTADAGLTQAKIVKQAGDSVFDLKLRYQPIITAQGALIGVSVDYRRERKDRLPPGQYGLVLEAARGSRIGAPVDLQEMGSLTIKRVTEFKPNSGPFKVFLVHEVDGQLYRVSTQVILRPKR